jgi:hypothetical protein
MPNVRFGRKADVQTSISGDRNHSLPSTIWTEQKLLSSPMLLVIRVKISPASFNEKTEEIPVY